MMPSLLAKYQSVEYKPTGARSAWGEQIENVMNLVGDDICDNKRYAYWCGRLKRFKDNPDAIYRLIKSAKEGRNAAALFQFLLKKK